MNEKNLPTTAIDEANNQQVSILNAPSPAALVQSATEMAEALSSVINRQKLYNTISGKKFVKVEGWTTLAAMLGVMPQEVSNEQQQDGRYIAIVELVRMSDGRVISRASAECGATDEQRWADADQYAVRSMAATRATSKACRLAFSWIMTLAGYEATPAEEMQGKAEQNVRQQSGGNHTGEASQYGDETHTSEAIANEKQQNMIYARLNAAGISTDVFEMEFGKIESLPFKRVNQALKWIEKYKTVPF